MNKNQAEYYKSKLFKTRKNIIRRISHAHNEATELSYIDNHPADTSDEDYEKLKDQVLRKEEEKKLQEIENAIIKIHDGCYGVCEICEGVIDKERLEVIPYTRYCSLCAKELYDNVDYDPKIRPINELFYEDYNRE